MVNYALLYVNTRIHTHKNSFSVLSLYINTHKHTSPLRGYGDDPSEEFSCQRKH